MRKCVKAMLVFSNGDYDELLREGGLSLDDIREFIDAKCPANPLIKDKRIRKAVRAWAEANNIEEVRYEAHRTTFKWANFEISFDYDFDIYDSSIAMKYYTIAELCGEEENDG